MIVFGLWHGGSSYALGEIDTDLERFPSLASAQRALQERSESNGARSCLFRYIDRGDTREYCPVVEGSSMLVYLSDPREVREPYPDFLLSIGPRGGIKKEVC